MATCPICGAQTDKSIEAAPEGYQHRCTEQFLKNRDAKDKAASLEPRGSTNMPAMIPEDDSPLWHNFLRALEDSHT